MADKRGKVFVGTLYASIRIYGVELNTCQDWQPFLLSAGYSDTLGARISQLVDLDWGNCTEHLTDIMDSEVPIKLFSQKTVLCVGAELVPLPPNRAKKVLCLFNLNRWGLTPSAE